MERFEFAAPTSVADAIRLHDGAPGETELLAGGTDLLSLMKDFIARPRRVVSLQSVPGLDGIAPVEGGGIRIGAMARLDDLLASSDLSAAYPALIHAAQGVRSAQLRAMGTIGGDLLQRPRCWYFRRGHGLVAQKDGTSMVEAGDHRDHAVFGNSGPAKYVNPSSFAPALVALRARLELSGRKGTRSIDASALHRAPKSSDEREFTLEPGEILTGIVLPAAPRTSATYEVRHRHGLDWPLAAAAAVVDLDGAKVRSARVVLGHVAPTPWAVDVGGLAGKELDEAAAEAAARTAVAGATPLPGNVQKVELARVAVKRALLRAVGRWSGS